MVEERLDGGRRHRVHRAPADQLLDVPHVAQPGVLGGGGCPQASLRRGSGLGQALPPRAAELLPVVAVGQPRVGDRQPTGQVRGRPELLQPAIGLGVVGEPRVHLQRDPAVTVRPCAVEHRPEQVARLLHVALDQPQEHLVRIGHLAQQLAQLLVIGVPVRDRGGEDRRVGRDPAVDGWACRQRPGYREAGCSRGAVAPRPPALRISCWGRTRVCRQRRPHPGP